LDKLIEESRSWWVRAKNIFWIHFA
jgi:hypothetical protein